MNLRDRIARRQRPGVESRLIRDYGALSPIEHAAEPTGRGPTLERLLDHLDPALDVAIPPDGYVWGPKGSGKSALVNALFEHLAEMSSRSRSPILTTTRATAPPGADFVYVDARETGSKFGLYHAVLDSLAEESVPKQGVRTAQLRARLRDELGSADRRVVLAVDHLEEPQTLSVPTVGDMFRSFSDSLSVLGVGRTPPEEVGWDGTAVRVRPYRHHSLVDVLTSRTSDGLGREAASHEVLREIAEWADGDAHDALTAVFGAADEAMRSGGERIRPEHVEKAAKAIPRPCVSLGQVFALPANRRRVLYRLLDLDGDRPGSVRATASAVAEFEDVDLSPGTVTRILYELAEEGIVRRVRREDADGVGRPPSRIEPQFPTLVFRRLFELNDEPGR
jgi:Cdc6-like AAA superfamily ATPase